MCNPMGLILKKSAVYEYFSVCRDTIIYKSLLLKLFRICKQAEF